MCNPIILYVCITLDAERAQMCGCMTKQLTTFSNIYVCMIEFKDASLRSGSRRLFYNLSFTVREGETVVVCGGKGSGKTALLMSMLGLLPLDEGYVCFDGEPVTAMTAPMFREKMAYMPQAAPEGDMSVVQLIDMLFELKSHDTTEYSRKHLFAVWKELQLDKALFDRPVSQLSRSQLQLVLLGSALLADRKVVLLDEPLADLDDGQVQCALACIRRMAERGASVLLTTSDNRSMAVCDRVVSLNDFSKL